MLRSRHPAALLAGLILPVMLLGGCADDLSPPDHQDDDTTQDGLPGPGGPQATFTATGGYYHGDIDTTAGNWVYIDLETQTQVAPDAPDASDDWDIAFLGTDIKLNGGVSGAPPGGQPVVVYPDKVDAGTPYPWESVTGAPPPSAVDYLTDERGGLFTGFATQYVFANHPEADLEPDRLTGEGDHGWYHDAGIPAGSAITARDNVAYVIRSVECRYFNLRMTGYSSPEGSDGHPQFDLIEIPGSPCSTDGGGVVPLGAVTFSGTADGQRADVDASSEEAWVYIDLTNALQVEPANPDDELTWDIAVQRTDIRLNGGASGPGDAALHDMLGGDWTSTTSVPGDAEWHSDETDALAFVTYPPAENTGDGACGGINGDFGWYYYSGFCNDGNGVHHISPRDVVYVVRDRSGTFWRLRMLGYYDDAGSSAHPSFEFAPIQ